MPDSMPTRFDVVLIGSGPAAVAALAAAPARARIGIVTGATRTRVRVTHSKIRAVAFERRELPGVGDIMPFTDGNAGSLFSTATVGGLASYWGQQFVRYAPADPWPRDIFGDHAAYLRACAAIEAMFRIEGSGGDQDTVSLGGSYLASSPRLLVGTAAAVDAGLLAMRAVFADLASKAGATIIGERAVSFARDGDDVKIRLENGDRLAADRLIIAAGVVGSLRLIMAACPEIAATRFDDHAPFMLYALGAGALRSRLPRRPTRHFNALTIEHIEHDRTRLFASLYDMRHASMSLFLAAVGLPPALRGWRAPQLAGVLSPIQVWTQATRQRIEICADGRVAVVENAPAAADDPDATALLGWLKSQGVRVRVGGSAPGMGFHYHRATLSLNHVDFTSPDIFLTERFGNVVHCVDASLLGTIGCRPPTLTAMAAALERSKRAWQGEA